MSLLVRPASGESTLGLGAAALGNLYRVVSDDAAFATVDAAWDAGVRFFDTAPHYGLGLAERRLGAALAGRPRHEFLLSTKVGRLLVPNDSPSGSDLSHGGFDVPDDLVRRRDYSSDGVLRSLEQSLDRLGLDRVDVVLVHDPEAYMREVFATALPALHRLRDEGVVGAIGVGMNLVQPLRRIVAEGDVDVVMVAGRWTLLDRSAAPLLDECAERGVAVLAAGPFNSGILAQPWPTDVATFDYAAAPAEELARARALAEACLAAGTTLPAAALQFTLRHPAVVRVIAGMRSPEEVAEAAARITEPIPEALWPVLDRTAQPQADAGARTTGTGV